MGKELFFMKIPKVIKAIIAFVLVATSAIFAFSACGAQGMFSWLQGYKSSLVGSSYTISTYDHYGVMDTRITGERIDMDANYIFILKREWRKIRKHK